MFYICKRYRWTEKAVIYRYGWMEVFCYRYVATVIARRNAGLKRIQRSIITIYKLFELIRI